MPSWRTDAATCALVGLCNYVRCSHWTLQRKLVYAACVGSTVKSSCYCLEYSSVLKKEAEGF